MLKASKIPINIGDMVRVAPDLISLYPANYSNLYLTMYNGDKAPGDGEAGVNVIKQCRFRREDTGLVLSISKYEYAEQLMNALMGRRNLVRVLSISKYEYAEQGFYLKLLTTDGLIGWVCDHNLVLC